MSKHRPPSGSCVAVSGHYCIASSLPLLTLDGRQVPACLLPVCVSACLFRLFPVGRLCLFVVQSCPVLSSLVHSCPVLSAPACPVVSSPILACPVLPFAVQLTTLSNPLSFSPAINLTIDPTTYNNQSISNPTHNDCATHPLAP